MKLQVRPPQWLVAFVAGFTVAAFAALVLWHPGKTISPDMQFTAIGFVGLMVGCFAVVLSQLIAKIPKRVKPIKPPSLKEVEAMPSQRKRVASSLAVLDAETAQPSVPSISSGPTEPQPIVIVRQARNHAGDWDGAKSWFGGLPKLGDSDWPRDKADKPLFFAAQIDMAALNTARPGHNWPSRGALAFFFGAGSNVGAVRYVSPQANAAFTPPPSDLPAAYEPGGDIFPQDPTPYARKHYPRWPIELLPADVPAELREYRAGDREADAFFDRLEAHREAVKHMADTKVEKAELHFSIKQLGDGDIPFWWHSVGLYLEHLRRADHQASYRTATAAQRLEEAKAHTEQLRQADPLDHAKLAEQEQWIAAQSKRDERLAEQLAALPQLIAEVESALAGKLPWQRLSTSEVRDLVAFNTEVRKTYAQALRYALPNDLYDLATASVKAMITGDSTAFDALPANLRNAINQSYRRTAASDHQMFGIGVDIQGTAIENLDDVMLLQLSYDDMIDWQFGDNGAYQFFISHADLAAGRWHKARVEFECH